MPLHAENWKVIGVSKPAEKMMVMPSNSSGPTHCDICGEWPARQTERGKRCHLCESREWCDAHPVPLPSNLETVKELADLGYTPAIRHLSQNAKHIRDDV